MKIKGKTVQLFLPTFLRSQNLSDTISNTNLMTIYNIISSYVQICLKKDSPKVSVKELTAKAGYSRTTFYTYFTEINDIYNMLADMVSYHMYINSAAYCSCFLGKATESEQDEILSTIENFTPFINALMKTPGYENRYINDFNDAFNKTLNIADIPKNIRPQLINALSATMVALIKTLDDSFSLANAMTISQRIIQSIVNQNIDR